MRRLGVRALKRCDASELASPSAPAVSLPTAVVQDAAVDELGDGAWTADVPNDRPLASGVKRRAEREDGKSRQRKQYIEEDQESDSSHDADRKPSKSRRRRALESVQAGDVAEPWDPSAAAVAPRQRPPPAALPRQIRSSPLLRGSAFAAALAEHPALGLDAYNRDPTLRLQALPYAMIRYAAAAPPAPPAGGGAAAVAASACSAPFTSVRDVGSLVGVFGVKNIYELLRYALRAAGSRPLDVLVPIRAVDAPPAAGEGGSGAVPLRPMLYVPDAPVAGEAEGPGHSGWIISRGRFENRLHGGARR